MHKTAVSLINPSFSISARARTSQAKILHLDQKAAKCTTCKRFCGKFLSCFQQDCDQNLSTRFKTRNGKMSRGEWVKQVCSFQYPSTTTLYRKIIFSQGFQQSSSNKGLCYTFKNITWFDISKYNLYRLFLVVFLAHSSCVFYQIHTVDGFYL